MGLKTFFPAKAKTRLKHKELKKHGGKVKPLTSEGESTRRSVRNFLNGIVSLRNTRAFPRSCR